MKIWLVNQYASTPETGGSVRHANIGRELAAMGHDITVVAARWHHKLIDVSASLAAAEVEDRGGWRYVRLPTWRYNGGSDPRRIGNWARFALALSRLDKRLGETPDVVLYSSPSLFGYFGAERLARRTGALLIFEVRDIWPLTLTTVGNKSARHPLIRVMQWTEDRALRGANAVVSNLPNAVEHMVTRGMPPEKFTWIPNGFNAADMAEPEPLDPAAAEAIPKDRFVVGYAGSHAPANALDTLLDAAALVRNNPRIVFVLAGFGNQKLRLQARVRDENLTNVRFIDPVPKRQVATLLRRFDLCYNGMLDEPLYRFGVAPNKLFDYFGAGRPVLFSVDAGSYRPVETFGAGIQVPPEDPVAIRDAVVRLSEMTPDTLEAMGRAGHENALAIHEFGALARRLEEEVIMPLSYTKDAAQ